MSTIPGGRPLHRARRTPLVETVFALEQHGFGVEVVRDPNAAREAASPAFPKASPPLTNTSVTLQETGIADAIDVGDRHELPAQGCPRSHARWHEGVGMASVR